MIGSNWSQNFGAVKTFPNNNCSMKIVVGTLFAEMFNHTFFEVLFFLPHLLFFCARSLTPQFRSCKFCGSPQLGTVQNRHGESSPLPGRGTVQGQCHLLGAKNQWRTKQAGAKIHLSHKVHSPNLCGLASRSWLISQRRPWACSKLRRNQASSLDPSRMGEASLAEAGQTASVDEFREFNRKSFSEYSRASCEEDVQQSLATLAGSGPIGRKPSKPSLDDLVCADHKPSLDDLIRNVSTSSPRAQEPLAERRRRGGVDHASRRRDS